MGEYVFAYNYTEQFGTLYHTHLSRAIFRAKYVARMASYGPTTAWEVRQNWISDH